MIISFIGVRGAGKTTQCRMLESYLLNGGRAVRVVKAFDDEMKSNFLEMISRNSYLANVFMFCMLYRREVDAIEESQLEGHLVITDRFIEHFLLHLPAPLRDAGVVTYIQPHLIPHLILRGVIGLVALARRTFPRRCQPQLLVPTRRFHEVSGARRRSVPKLRKLSVGLSANHDPM